MDPLAVVADILEIVKGVPSIVAAVKEALQEQGYTVAEVEAIFAEVKPPGELGIDPNHPFAPEPSATPASAALADVLNAGKTASQDIADAFDTGKAAVEKTYSQAQVSQAQPFIHATHVPIPGAPVGLPEPAPGVTPPPVPFERAR